MVFLYLHLWHIKSQPSVAYKSVAYKKKKRVIALTNKDHCSKETLGYLCLRCFDYFFLWWHDENLYRFVCFMCEYKVVSNEEDKHFLRCFRANLWIIRSMKGEIMILSAQSDKSHFLSYFFLHKKFFFALKSNFLTSPGRIAHINMWPKAFPALS